MQRYGPRRTLSVDLRRALHLGGNPCDFQVYAAGLLSGISGGCIAGRTERFESVRDLADGRRTDDPRGDRACIFGSQTVIVQRDSNSVAADQSSPARHPPPELSGPQKRANPDVSQWERRKGAGSGGAGSSSSGNHRTDLFRRAHSASSPQGSLFYQGETCHRPRLGMRPFVSLLPPLSAELRLATVSAPGGMAQVRIARCQRRPDCAYGDANLGPHLEQTFKAPCCIAPGPVRCLPTPTAGEPVSAGPLPSRGRAGFNGW